jgi:hypothetical protein
VARGEINFDNGTFTASLGTGAIENVGNGWFRVSLSANLLSASHSFGFYTDSTTGTRNVYAWGAQANIGSTAKPYFPTTDRLNVPRLTYQNGGGGCPSLLLEKQSTNLTLWSEDFTQSDWIKANASITANNTTSPDGTQNADKIVEDTSNSSHGAYQAISVTNGIQYTWSGFFKAAGRTKFRLYAQSASTPYVEYDLSNGTIISTGGSVTGSIESMGNGWYRCIATTTTSGTTGYFNIAIEDASGNVVYTGDGTSGIFAWGAQMEASSYVTTLIPTTSASATRVEDACSKTGIGSLIGQTSGTLFVQWINLNNDLCNLIETYNSTSGITGTSSILIQKSANNEFNIRVFDSLGNYSDNFTATIPLGTNKIALAYESGSAILYLNGLSIGSNSRTYVFVSTRDTISFDNRGGYARSEVVLFKTRLTNAELASLTTL